MSAQLLPHYLLEADLEGYTAWADDEDFNLDKAEEFIKQIFGIGYERAKQLEELVKPNRDGNYWIPNASNGQYASFDDQANLKHMVKSYPWLHQQDSGLAIDPDKAKESNGDLERYLAAVDPDDWDQFIEDLKVLCGDYPVLDEDEAQELEMKEQQRWAESDGMPELKKTLMALAADSFTAFVISQVRSTKIFWEWCQEVQTWPERDGESSVYMDVEKHVEPEHVEWFLEQLPNLAGFQRRWQQIKREFWESPSTEDTPTGARTQGDVFDELVRSVLVPQDPECQRAYAKMDNEDLYRFFLRLTPDGVYHDTTRPRWIPVKDDYGEDPYWVCSMADPMGFDKLGRSWRNYFKDGMKVLLNRPEAAQVLRQADRHEPLEHPQLPLGEARRLFEGNSMPGAPARLATGSQRAALSLNEADHDLPPDDNFDPEAWLRRGGDMRIQELWRDNSVRIVRPLDMPALNALQLGRPQNGFERNPGNLYYGFPVVVLTADTNRCLGAFNIEDGQIEPIGMSRTKVWEVCADKAYGRSARRGLIALVRGKWRATVRSTDDYQNDKVIREFGNTLACLNILGGNGEVQRFIKSYARHPIARELKRFGLFLGLRAAVSGDLKSAADYLKPDTAKLEARGAWLGYYGYEALAVLFDNENWASDVFQGETYDWFDYHYDKHSRPDLGDALDWLTPKAYAYIRDLLINREVFFPEGGPTGEGAWVVVTRDMLNEYTDSDLWEWVKDPNPEEESQGTYDDIIEAVQNGAANMLSMVSRDQLESKVTKLALSELDAIKSEWGTTSTGKDVFLVLVPWKSLTEAFEKASEDNGNGLEYDNDLASMMLEAHKGAISTERIEADGGWPDEKDSSADYYREECSTPLLELEMTRFPEDRNQLQLKLGDSLLRELQPVLEAAAERVGAELYSVHLADLGDRITLECDAEPALTVPGQAALKEAVGREVFNLLAQQGVYTSPAILDETSTGAHPRFFWSLE